MNTSNNIRRRQSVQKIEKTFVELLQTREISEITVSDICKRCSLNRSTFYANFIDIYDLADKVSENLECEVENLYKDEHEHGYNSNNFLRLLHHIMENQLFYRTYFKLGYDNKIDFRYDTNRAERYFGNQNIAYHIEFFKSGFNAVVKMWLAGGCAETPEEINEIIMSEYRGRTE